MHIREAAPADAEAVAAVRVAGWRYAYAGVMPQSYLDSLSETEDAARHRERLATSRAGGRDLVAVDEEGTLTGWASCGPYRDDDGERSASDAELYALYVRPDLIGTGVGRRLTDAVRQEALGRGAARLFVWVVETNARARRFYERAGFAADGGRDDFEVGGRTLTDLRYVQEMKRERAAERGSAPGTAHVRWPIHSTSRTGTPVDGGRGCIYKNVRALSSCPHSPHRPGGAPP